MIPTADAPLSTGEPSKRERRSQDSRERILEAAVACLLEDGYRGATTLRIQDRAGVSRGRLLHHFPSRDALLVAATEHLSGVRVRDAMSGIDRSVDSGADAAGRIRGIVTQMWLTFHEPHFAASLELWVAARTNPEIAETLLPGERFLGEVINATLNRIWGTACVEHPLFDTLRELLLTSMRGVAVTYTFRPRDPLADPNLERWVSTSLLLLDLQDTHATNPGEHP